MFQTFLIIIIIDYYNHIVRARRYFSFICINIKYIKKNNK